MARAVAAAPQKKAAPVGVKGPKRPQKSHTPVYIALGGLAAVLIVGVILVIVMMSPSKPPEHKNDNSSQGPASGGPGDLFKNVKPQ